MASGHVSIDPCGFIGAAAAYTLVLSLFTDFGIATIFRWICQRRMTRAPLSRLGKTLCYGTEINYESVRAGNLWWLI
jgi:hypothetical protein